MITQNNFYPLAPRFLPDVSSAQMEEYLPPNSPPGQIPQVEFPQDKSPLDKSPLVNFPWTIHPGQFHSAANQPLLA
jgi:hypothetical protein